MKKSLLVLYLLVQVYYSGYAQQEQISTDSLYSLSLEELMNIDITVASKKSEKLSDAPGVISVLTREDIDRFGGISLRDILERVPSLSPASGFWTDRNAIASRGDMVKFNSSHVLILIDGRPTREIVEGGIVSDMLGAFPVNIIERIEVIRGPGSVLYGSNAMSAVINIVTKEVDRNNVVYSEIRGKGGANGRTLNGQFAVKDLKVTLAGRMLEKEVRNYSYTYPVADFFGVVSDTATITGSIPDKSAGAFVNVAYKGLRLSTSLQDYRTGYLEQNVFGLNKWTKNFYNAGYDFKLTSKWNSSFNLTMNRTTMQTGEPVNVKRKGTDQVIEWTNYFTLSERMNLVTGVLYNHMKGQENSTDPTSGVDTISHNSRGAYALYAQLDYWAMPNKLKLIGGFQANKMEKLDLDVVPRAGLIFYPTERINIKALYGKAFRAGTVNETGINYLGLFVGNPNLKPEHVENFDLGINYQGKKLSVGVNYFHSTQKNSIVRGTKMNAEGNPELMDLGGGFFFPVTTYNNIQDFSIQGLELEGKYYVTKNLYFTGSMLYQKIDSDPILTKNMFGGTDTTQVRTQIPNFGIKAGLSYTASRGVTVSVFNIYQGELKKDLYPQNGLNPVNASSSHNVLNMYINLDFIKMLNIDSNKKLSLFMQGENMLDENIWANHDGTITPYVGGRSIYAGIVVGL
jgi:outer membrane receptor for ferrienterochelin and colicins